MKNTHDLKKLFVQGYDLPANKFPPEHRAEVLGWCAVWWNMLQRAEGGVSADELRAATKSIHMTQIRLHGRVFEALFICTVLNHELVDLTSDGKYTICH